MRSIDKALYASAVVLGLAVLGLGVQALMTRPVTAWFTASAALWLSVMVVSLLMARRGNFFAVVAALFATIVVGRLYGTLRLAEGQNTSSDPLLLAETGPGIPSVMWLATAMACALALWLLSFLWRHRHGAPWGAATPETWALVFVRLYVGLMFIPHFAGHLFAGPAQFAIFEGYFGSIGLNPPALMVMLGGLAEAAAGIGLCLGLFTRLSALVGSSFLFFSMWWGKHFDVGYIWILPIGGWEFGIFWAAMVGLFIFMGGGTVSLDHVRRQRSHSPGMPTAQPT